MTPPPPSSLRRRWFRPSADRWSSCRTERCTTIAGNQAVRARLNPTVFGSTATTDLRRHRHGGLPHHGRRRPEGQYAILFTGTGNAYLYNALIDDFTVSKQIFTTMTGLVGPVAAGPNGQYYVVNGVVLNSSLTPVLNGPSGTGATRRPARPRPPRVPFPPSRR